MGLGDRVQEVAAMSYAKGGIVKPFSMPKSIGLEMVFDTDIHGKVLLHRYRCIEVYEEANTQTRKEKEKHDN